ncbi:hypothetical protein Bca52824_094308 [Brassica carinata]|uniref:F-box/LRR-repeat protein 15/At3g58940/PEG3-like LRR domain-containing protein n=1 Tax=Brassica carinata TaxID=52824 RepID=A0A8X7TJX6_BRACI|nr:hypothetical protein Bca52824_094308 [Brassica carinata]
MGSTTLHPDWTELTRECLIDIFSRLSMGKRWDGPMLVCKKWMNVCQDTSLNAVLDLETEFLSSTDTTIYWWSPEFEEKVDSIIRSVVDQSQGELKELRVRHCTNESLSYVAERCPNLEVLSVKYSPKVTVESMRKIALNCTKLKELDISCSYEISCECMELVGTNCKNLQVLKRNLMEPSEVKRLRRYACVTQQYLSSETLGNVDAYTIGRHMPQLKHLELRDTTLTDKALAHLCKRCSNLEYLDLVGCSYLTSVGIANGTSSLKNLKEIKKPDFDATLFY